MLGTTEGTVRSSNHVGLCRAISTLVLVSACRLGFGQQSPDASEGLPDSPADACAFGAWRTPASRTPLDKLNTGATEWASEISGDGLRVVFGSDQGGRKQDVYLAQRASRSDVFDPPTRLSINTPGEDTDPSLSDDALELYFMSDRGGSDCIYVTNRTSVKVQDWRDPRRLSPLCEAGTPRGVYVSRDGLRLYYNAGADLVMTSRENHDADFSVPGKPIGGAGLDFCAFTADELTMYCEMNVDGRPQIAQATRASRDAVFGEGQLVPELASAEAEAGDPSLTSDGKTLVFSSNINGNHDLYQIERDCE